MLWYIGAYIHQFYNQQNLRRSTCVQTCTQGNANYQPPVTAWGWDCEWVCEISIDILRIHGTGIFTWIWLISMLSAGKYTSPMDPTGQWFFCGNGSKSILYSMFCVIPWESELHVCLPDLGATKTLFSDVCLDLGTILNNSGGQHLWSMDIFGILRFSLWNGLVGTTTPTQNASHHQDCHFSRELP